MTTCSRQLTPCIYSKHTQYGGSIAGKRTMSWIIIQLEQHNYQTWWKLLVGLRSLITEKMGGLRVLQSASTEWGMCNLSPTFN